jgi:hypothetical protein
MLISKSKLSEGSIATFKLVNGDEIIAKVTSINETSYLLNRPCTVMPSSQGLGLIQSLFAAEPDIDVEISKNHVMMAANAFDKIQDHYIQTTTGIKPVKGIIK